MGVAIDTISTHKTNPGATGAAVTVATGDSLTVKYFPPTAYAHLERVVRVGATEGFVEVKSPTLHDDVRGIRFQTSETPSVFLLPQQVGQPLTAGDTLAVTVSGGAAETDQAVLQVYYSTAQGISARLHSWADIAGAIKNVKVVDVITAVTGTQGEWTDEVITHTEDLLHVQSTYAVLGILSDTALAAVGVKGQCTGNLRVCLPGVTSTDDTTNGFIMASQYHGTPHIPVFAGITKGSVYVSAVNDGSTAAAHLQLVLAELSTKVTP